MTLKTQSPRPWRATCIQMLGERASQAPDFDSARALIARNRAKLVGLIEAACASEQKPDLVVFPEFAMQGPPLGMAVETWIERACSPVPGWLTEPLQALAAREGIYICGNAFEAPPEWPGRYFNTSFIIGPTGEVILRYRRLNTAAFPSVHDFMTDYLAVTPREEIFPVADTPLGKLGVIPCGEINVPEVARVMMMQGAEVILHPTNSRHSDAQEAAKLARVAENMTYLVSANIAGAIGFSPDGTHQGGRSHILDHLGQTLAFEDGAGESVSVSALIDIERLRRDRRADSGLSNPHLRARYELYVPFYAEAKFYPPDMFLEAPMTDVRQTEAAVAQARRNLEQAGILAPLAPGAQEPVSTVEL
ncbi:nitrilase-related carbon-nitrogen hydrolase [Celeribacter indicus]|uniref:Putative amidohydrolase n=1 Tax=Celeribacter indicus TaxID=1208324 RepID=A0A0B5E3F1_9RHOB|nr:nitrilase-related carbon-nitrogen hydrolase [Celeribacter indicus]AJE47591.1 putative amidohydrolase [Celeribacter indicus]SDW11217.1 Predicted amidohydrolase [Celeribacter indicus]